MMLTMFVYTTCNGIDSNIPVSEASIYSLDKSGLGFFTGQTIGGSLSFLV